MQVEIPLSGHQLKLMDRWNHQPIIYFIRNRLTMKRLMLTAIIFGLGLPLAAQEIQKIMEDRAREMHRVIGLSEKEQWKKFITENYTQALIDKPMRAVVESSDDASLSSTSNETKAKDNVEAKAAMFQQLHNDFGKSKIISIKPDGEKLEMVVTNTNGLSGTFILKFAKDKPYLIDGLGIEVQDIEK